MEPGDHGVRPETAAAGDRLIARFDPADPEHNVELIRDHLTESIGKVVGGRHLAAPDTNLFDLGLDSLVLIEVVAKLAEELGFEVQAASFVEFPTIRSFVDNLAELMGLAPARPRAATPRRAHLPAGPARGRPPHRPGLTSSRRRRPGPRGRPKTCEREQLWTTSESCC
ncbi:acyl carrier protein [Streptomyces sp. ARC32]